MGAPKLHVPPDDKPPRTWREWLQERATPLAILGASGWLLFELVFWFVFAVNVMKGCQ